MKKILTYSSLVAGSLALGFLGSQIGLEQRITSTYERAVKKHYIHAEVTCTNDETMGTYFSSQEKFVSKNQHSALANKVGFSFEVDKRIKEDIDSEESKRMGLTYDFEVKSGYPKPVEQLVISHHNDGSMWAQSVVFLKDTNRDGRLDSVYITDRRNNTSITLRRNDQEEMEFVGADKETAKFLYDKYSSSFLKFKEENRIEERLKNYSPRLEITEIVK